MGRIVGIDLGTTYSAVAVPEERAGEGFFIAPGCAGHSIVLDKLKRRITPSVVAEDSNGNVIVGYSAKNRAGLCPEPIMFAKRSMGVDKSFPLGKQGELRPEEVSAHVLRYLKTMASERLGEPVDEAVITVPAYFDMRAKQATEKAGELAGLKVAQVAPEPVAAALMYCAGDPRDPLRIMTYDLGGGTFDVAILEKRDGILSQDSIIAFDGDRFLGGYNFDKKLALWIMDQLVAKGYDLKLDLDKTEDRVVFAKLMVYAERAKLELSRFEQCEINEVSTNITDHSGNPVVIEGLVITRDEFERMIQDDIEYSIQMCERARTEKASKQIAKDGFDEILMVGGSSKIPLVARRLEKEYGRKPKLVEPDLCVALGASILAGTKPKSYGRLKLHPIPEQTDLPSLLVSGEVLAGNGAGTPENCSVSLRAADGSYNAARTTGRDGKFVFDGIPLAPDETTDFTLRASSAQGAEVASHRFSVTQTQALLGPSAGQVAPVTNMLAKPIGILTVDGVHVVAPERTPLPFEKPLRASTTDTSGTVKIVVLEENNRLGEIVLSEIPDTLPVGSALEITLSVQENYQIRARCYIPSLAREGTAVIEIPVPPQKTLEELRRELEVLNARAKDVLSQAGAGAKFGDNRVRRLNDRLRAAKEMLGSRHPEAAQIQECLDEVAILIQDIGLGWRPEPPRAALEQQAAEAQDLLARAIKRKPKVAEDGYDKQIEAIVKEAAQAYERQDGAAWKDCYHKLRALCDRLEAIADADTGGPGGGGPDPAQLLMALSRELAEAEKFAKQTQRYEQFKPELEALAQDLRKIDPGSPQAMTQIRDWYLTKFADLKRRLDAPDKDKGLPKV